MQHKSRKTLPWTTLFLLFLRDIFEHTIGSTCWNYNLGSLFAFSSTMDVLFLACLLVPIPSMTVVDHLITMSTFLLVFMDWVLCACAIPPERFRFYNNTSSKFLMCCC